MLLQRTVGKQGDAEWGLPPNDTLDDDVVAVFDTELGYVVALNKPAVVDVQYPETEG